MGLSFYKINPRIHFKYIFWQKQLEAARKKDAQDMRWHPLMIHWCLYIRHRWVKVPYVWAECSCIFLRSSGTYESLRSSGCLHLSSQQTLRDYMHYMEAGGGFLSDVDKMLMIAANTESCSIRKNRPFLPYCWMKCRTFFLIKHSGHHDWLYWFKET